MKYYFNFFGITLTIIIKVVTLMFPDNEDVVDVLTMTLTDSRVVVVVAKYI